MAINKSSQTKLQGTLDGVTYYEQNGKQIAKISNGISKTQFENDPALVRTRENAQEFKITGESTKVLYDMLRPITVFSKDSKLFIRLNKVMHELKKMDTTSLRGERRPFNSLNDASGKNLLKGLNFNERAKMESILFKPFAVDTSLGALTIEGFDPKIHMVSDPSATHFSMTLSKADINLFDNNSELAVSNEYQSTLSAQATDVSLQLSSDTTINGLQLFVLQISFYQEVNGVKYLLNNKAYNTSKIIEVL
jgi:hypothetical protein